METKLEKEVRFLKIYAVVVTLFGAVFLLTAFAHVKWMKNSRKNQRDSKSRHSLEPPSCPFLLRSSSRSDWMSAAGARKVVC